MPGRQHEAVAVRPVRSAGVELQVLARRARSPRPPCPSAGPDARSSPAAPRPSPAPAARPPSSSGRGGAGGARGCSPGRAFPARGAPAGSEGAGTGAQLPARPRRSSAGFLPGLRAKRPRPTSAHDPPIASGLRATDCIRPLGCLKREPTDGKRRDESDHRARSPARGGVRTAAFGARGPRRPPPQPQPGERALRERITALESEKAELADELERLRVKRDKDVAALDDLIAQLKPLIEEV